MLMGFSKNWKKIKIKKKFTKQFRINCPIEGGWNIGYLSVDWIAGIFKVEKNEKENQNENIRNEQR